MYLIDEIKQDTFNNIDDADIIKGNFKIMEHLAKTDLDIDFINKQLKDYGWHIDDLCELYRTINNLNEYCLRTDTKTKEDAKVLSDVLDFLHKEYNL